MVLPHPAPATPCGIARRSDDVQAIDRHGDINTDIHPQEAFAPNERQSHSCCRGSVGGRRGVLEQRRRRRPARPRDIAPRELSRTGDNRTGDNCHRFLVDE
jgi:hypothetical protein